MELPGGDDMDDSPKGELSGESESTAPTYRNDKKQLLLRQAPE